jgi:divalent metal cation (Fe/Co/Zn/Cd) transporter
MTFIDFHLVVPGAMSVAEAHDICDRIEARLRDKVDDAMITIHVEPEEKASIRALWWSSEQEVGSRTASPPKLPPPTSCLLPPAS